MTKKMKLIKVLSKKEETYKRVKLNKKVQSFSKVEKLKITLKSIINLM